MERNVIKDFKGVILGYIEEDSNGNQICKDSRGKKLGSYDKKSNVTKDIYGKKLSKGNTVVSLLYK